MQKSAAQLRIEAQCSGASAPFDQLEALRLLREARVYASRHASIGAQKLAEEINRFVCTSSDERS